MAVTKMISRLHIEIKQSLYLEGRNLKSHNKVVSDITSAEILASKLKFFSEYLVKCQIGETINAFQTTNQFILPIGDFQKFVDSGKVVIQLKIGDSFVSLEDEGICPKSKTVAELIAYSQEKNPRNSEMVVDISFVGRL